jgi:hypothetical protein
MNIVDQIAAMPADKTGALQKKIAITSVTKDEFYARK